jgi:hypothetical protein
MRRLGLLLLLAVTGCLQAAPAPLSPEPGIPLPAGIIGSWRCVMAGEDAAATLVVSEPTPRRYAFRFEAPGEEPFTFEGHASRLGEATVVNVRELPLKSDGSGWYFITATLHRPDLLELRHAEIEEIGPDLRAQVAGLLTTPDGFRQACACVPVPQEH